MVVQAFCFGYRSWTRQKSKQRRLHKRHI